MESTTTFSENFDFEEGSFIRYDNNDYYKESSVDIILLYADKNEREYIPNVPATFHESGDINLCLLIKQLKQESFPLESSMIFYHSSSDLFVYCGKDPLPLRAIIPSHDIMRQGNRPVITLRVRSQGQINSFSDSDYNQDQKLEFEEASTEPSEFDKEITNKSERRTRHKERKIGEVIDLVLRWRKLYNGYVDSETGKLVKMSLEESAKRIGVAKKSLDDYLLMIKHAKNSGFDFQSNHNERFGIIRAFVKKAKGAKSESSDGSDDEDKEYLPGKNKNSKKIKKDKSLFI